MTLTFAFVLLVAPTLTLAAALSVWWQLRSLVRRCKALEIGLQEAQRSVTYAQQQRNVYSERCLYWMDRSEHYAAHGVRTMTIEDVLIEAQIR